eukprot:Skav233412  [mRNA]  locus=scaffold892:176618:177865:+ [translate_table: standard]
MPRNGCDVEEIILERDENVTGTLDDEIGNLTALTYLDLDETHTTGDLASLKRLTQLQHLSLCKTQVTGELGSLQGMMQMQKLCLTDTHVAGDLANLQGMTQIEYLYLDNTDVAGDLENLQGMTQTRDLYLCNTRVTGDIASLQAMMQMEYLYLRNTDVVGELGNLQAMTQMEDLFLTNAHVTGDIASLQGATRMEELNLANTSVEGELTELLHWDSVTAINLQQTNVSGRLSSKWRGQWSKLRTLKLSGSQVEFLPQPDELQGLHSYFTPGHSDFAANAILPQLSVLELSGCPLDGDVKDLLLPLCGCPALATIDASGCKLSGTLTNLELTNVQVDWEPWLTWSSLLAESLKVLNLGSNNVSTIEGIPVQTKVMVLADNSAVAFASGVMKEALTAGTFVDLQNTTLSNSTETLRL